VEQIRLQDNTNSRISHTDWRGGSGEGELDLLEDEGGDEIEENERRDHDGTEHTTPQSSYDAIHKSVLAREIEAADGSFEVQEPLTRIESRDRMLQAVDLLCVRSRGWEEGGNLSVECAEIEVVGERGA
jgi:hypothetical protein